MGTKLHIITFLSMVCSQDNPAMQLSSVFSPKEDSDNVIKSRRDLCKGPRLWFAKAPLKTVKGVYEI